MSNEIDELMILDPLELTETDVAKIIQFHRNNRAAHAAGEKPKKADAGPKMALSLESLGLALPKVAGPAVKRRV